MITEYWELDEQLDKLRQNTLPPVWEQYVIKNHNNDPLKQLEDALVKIKNSDNYILKNDARNLLENLIDIDVDVDPIVSIYL